MNRYILSFEQHFTTIEIQHEFAWRCVCPFPKFKGAWIWSWNHTDYRQTM